MRLSSTRFRLACAGLTTGAIVAAVLVAPVAANAAAPTSAPGGGAPGSTATVVATGGYTGDVVGALFSTTNACPSPYAVTTPNVAATNVTKLSNNSISFTVPNLTLGTSSAPKTYYICTYTGATLAAATSVHDPSPYSAVPAGTLNPTTGASGGGNKVTMTLPSTAAVLPATPGVTFSSTACPATYGASPVNPVLLANVTRTSTTVLSATVPTTVLGTGLSTPFTMCIYAGRSTGSALIASNATPYAVTLPTTTLSSAIGPESTVPDPVNVTVSGPSTLFASTTTPVAVLVDSPTTAPTTCTPLYPASPGTNLSATLRKLSNSKAALTIPIGATVSGNEPTPYNICMYGSTSTTAGRLLSVATFTVADVPTISAVTPNSGSALGGSTITVTGQDFPTAPNALTATLGGTPLTSINVLDENTFTAVTPAHSIGAVTLAISSAIGSDTQAAAFTFENSIQAAPNTAPNSVTAQDVDVQGTGFLDYAFSNTANTGAHVYLVNGIYNNRATAAAPTIKANGPTADCRSVLVISDTELICSLNLTTALNADGSAVTLTSYRTSPVSTTVTGSNVVTLTTGTFGPNDIGQPIANATGTANFPAGTTILAVLSPTTAIMSQGATLGASAVATTIGYQSGSITAAGSSGNYTVTGLAGVFTQADIGRAVTAGTNTGTNPVVVAVDPTGATATLSVANTGSVTSVTLSSGNPVPNGAYNLTVVSDAAPNASTSDDYKQTIVSSGSTFTVAPF